MSALTRPRRLTSTHVVTVHEEEIHVNGSAVHVEITEETRADRQHACIRLSLPRTGEECCIDAPDGAAALRLLPVALLAFADSALRRRADRLRMAAAC